MTPEEQRIAIAKACGHISPRQTETGAFIASYAVTNGKEWGSHGIPDYPNDLNAMHDAEKMLADDPIKYSVFCHTLFIIINPTKNGEGTSEFDKIHATAAQRAEAFLKTLNLWKP